MWRFVARLMTGLSLSAFGLLLLIGILVAVGGSLWFFWWVMW